VEGRAQAGRELKKIPLSVSGLLIQAVDTNVPLTDEELARIELYGPEFLALAAQAIKQHLDPRRYDPEVATDLLGPQPPEANEIVVGSARAKLLDRINRVAARIGAERAVQGEV